MFISFMYCILQCTLHWKSESNHSIENTKKSIRNFVSVVNLVFKEIQEKWQNNNYSIPGVSLSIHIKSLTNNLDFINWMRVWFNTQISGKLIHVPAHERIYTLKPMLCTWRIPAASAVQQVLLNSSGQISWRVKTAFSKLTAVELDYSWKRLHLLRWNVWHPGWGLFKIMSWLGNYPFEIILSYTLFLSFYLSRLYPLNYIDNSFNDIIIVYWKIIFTVYFFISWPVPCIIFVI